MSLLLGLPLTSARTERKQSKLDKFCINRRTGSMYACVSVSVCICVHECAHSGLRLLPGFILSECVPTRLRVNSGKRRTSGSRVGGEEEEKGRGEEEEEGEGEEGGVGGGRGERKKRGRGRG